MTLKELNIFYHLCENSHVSNLAHSLNLTQSAISLAIKSLENKIGEPLFDRIGKKLILNEKGKLFKEKTYSHFLALHDAQNFFKNNKISGVLNIASSKTIGSFITPQIVFDFLDAHAHVLINKDIQNSSNIIQLVKQGKIDIGFIESECDERDVIKEKIGKDKLIIVSADKKLSSKNFYIDELFLKKWILREIGSGTREIFLNALNLISKDLPIFMEFSEFEEAKTILTKNIETITCLSKAVVEKELKREELFEVKLNNLSIERKFYLIYHKNKYKSKLFTEFEKFVKTHLV